MKSKSRIATDTDTDFEVVKIKAVSPEADGAYSIERSDGFSFWVPKGSPIVPRVGMDARFYPRGIFRAVRGLYIDNVKVFYRTAAEDEHHQAVQLYGADAREWLARWDAGGTVWSLTMGGFGPSYEQCIQITASEIVRYCLAAKFDDAEWSKPGMAVAIQKEIEHAVLNGLIVKGLELSGNQWSAALNLALNLYRRGPIDLLKDKTVNARAIQVCRYFPSVGPKPSE